MSTLTTGPGRTPATQNQGKQPHTHVHTHSRVHSTQHTHKMKDVHKC